MHDAGNRSMPALSRQLNETIDIRPISGAESLALRHIFGTGSIPIRLIEFDQSSANCQDEVAPLKAKEFDYDPQPPAGPRVTR